MRTLAPWGRGPVASCSGSCRARPLRNTTEDIMAESSEMDEGARRLLKLFAGSLDRNRSQPLDWERSLRLCHLRLTTYSRLG